MTVDPQQPQFTPEPPAAFHAEPPPLAPAAPPLPELAPPPPRKPWGFWATLGWGAMILLVNNLAATLVIAAFWVTILFGDGGGVDALANLDVSLQQATVKGLCPATLFATLLSVPMIVLLVRARRLPALEYLAITRIRLKPLLVSFAVMAALVFGLSFLYSKAGWEVGGKEMGDMFRASPSKALVLMILVVCAPVFEELLFRGFLFRGIAAKAGPAVAILLPSVLFASLHVQYKVAGVLYVLCLGLLFGAVRWRTGSTSITMLLHATVNFLGFLEIFGYLK